MAALAGSARGPRARSSSSAIAARRTPACRSTLDPRRSTGFDETPAAGAAEARDPRREGHAARRRSRTSSRVDPDRQRPPARDVDGVTLGVPLARRGREGGLAAHPGGDGHAGQQDGDRAAAANVDVDAVPTTDEMKLELAAARPPGVRRRDVRGEAVVAVPRAAAGPGRSRCRCWRSTTFTVSAPPRRPNRAQAARHRSRQQGAAAAVRRRSDRRRRPEVDTASTIHVVRRAAHGRQGRDPAGVGRRRAAGRPRRLLRQRADTKLFRASDVARTLEVKPLPETDRPASFAGAVGAQFSIDGRRRAARSSSSASRSSSTITVKSDQRLDTLALGKLDGPAACRRTSSPCPPDPPTGELVRRRQDQDVQGHRAGHRRRRPRSRRSRSRTSIRRRARTRRSTAIRSRCRSRAAASSARTMSSRSRRSPARRSRRAPIDDDDSRSSVRSSRCRARRRATTSRSAARCSWSCSRCSTRVPLGCSRCAAGSSARATSARKPPRSAPRASASRTELARADKRACTRHRRPAGRGAARPRSRARARGRRRRPARATRDRELLARPREAMRRCRAELRAADARRASPIAWTESRRATKPSADGARAVKRRGRRHRSLRRPPAPPRRVAAAAAPTVPPLADGRAAYQDAMQRHRCVGAQGRVRARRGRARRGRARHARSSRAARRLGQRRARRRRRRRPPRSPTAARSRSIRATRARSTTSRGCAAARARRCSAPPAAAPTDTLFFFHDWPRAPPAARRRASRSRSRSCCSCRGRGRRRRGLGVLAILPARSCGSRWSLSVAARGSPRRRRGRDGRRRAARRRQRRCARRACRSRCRAAPRSRSSSAATRGRSCGSRTARSAGCRRARSERIILRAMTTAPVPRRRVRCATSTRPSPRTTTLQGSARDRARSRPRSIPRPAASSAIAARSAARPCSTRRRPTTARSSTSSTATLPAIGSRVTGELDWARRRQHMAQHTAQHLLSGTLLDRAQAPTASARLGESALTIDVTRDRIPDAELAAAEDLANDIIDDDLAIRAWFPDAGELAQPEAAPRSEGHRRHPRRRDRRLRLLAVRRHALRAHLAARRDPDHRTPSATRA